jgi:hypothetical protein
MLPSHFRPAYSLRVSLRWPPQQRAEFTLGLSYFRGSKRTTDCRISNGTWAILNDRRAAKTPVLIFISSTSLIPNCHLSDGRRAPVTGFDVNAHRLSQVCGEKLKSVTSELHALKNIRAVAIPSAIHQLD